MKLTFSPIGAVLGGDRSGYQALVSTNDIALVVAKIYLGSWMGPTRPRREIQWLHPALRRLACNNRNAIKYKAGVEVEWTYTDTLQEAKAVIAEALMAVLDAGLK